MLVAAVPGREESMMRRSALPGDASYGKYVIEPLERGYGTTLGLSLIHISKAAFTGRRVSWCMGFISAAPFELCIVNRF